MKKLSILFALSTLTMQAMSAVPNTFVAGTAAKAAEVNQNFSYLNTKIDDLTLSTCKKNDGVRPGSYSYAVNDVAVGTTVLLNASGTPTQFTMVSFPIYDQLSGKRYAIKLPSKSNFDISISNTTTGCYRDMTISGYPASLNSNESQDFSHNSSGGYTFSKRYDMSELTIKVGNMRVDIQGLGFGKTSTINGTDGGVPFDLSDDISLSAQSSRMTSAILEVDNFIDYIVITEM